MPQFPEEAFVYLADLKTNNNRSWFEAHKLRFQELSTKVNTVFNAIETQLQQHDSIERWRMYRIYRDLRFSKDKTPYKTYFAATYARQKPQLRGGYYIHLEPNDQSFLEVGFKNPGSSDLFRVRKEWESDAAAVIKILENSRFKKSWGVLTGTQLKKAPLGFDPAHPAIDLLNLKQWRFYHYLNDQEVLANDFIQKVDHLYRQIRPFFDYMSEVLGTDLNGEPLW